MGVDLNLGATAVTTAQKQPVKTTVSEKKEEKASDSTAITKGAASTEAAVYEKSSDKDVAAAKADNEKATKTKNDRDAIIKQLKADAEARANQLLDIVKKTMQGQGKAIGIADDMWKFLASGDFEVDAATKKQAQEDISEDGYWGVEKTSDRMVDFAKALAGDYPDKADKMIEAFKKGYEEATKTWGKELPEISKQTYDSTLKKLEDWKNSANKVTETTKANEQAATQATAQTTGAVA